MSSATSLALSSPKRRTLVRRTQSSPVKAMAFTYCMFSSPNQSMPRTRSTAQVIKLPGRAFWSGATRTHPAPSTTTSFIASMTMTRPSALTSSRPSAFQARSTLFATGSSA